MSNTKTSQLKIILVAGGHGGLGKFIVGEFVANGNYNIKILTRLSSPAGNATDIEKYKPVSVEIVAADYSDHAGLVKALEGVDIVVSTVGLAILYDDQIALIKASEEAGAKRFISSEFSTDSSK
ncbi:hypothetical protein BC938DRAFT_473938 [Jimgerdemannia flammicorona]|uniref:NmrA-like domain-containing protein n=1 Tax=Jimgerdemannia flammicorona TaxID=994334 RepID=A0A433QZM6_9FUNG|nr:hypothetical protein BC938DRAFT_473938 [Jimgerdemannia flammicorona]